MAETPSLEPTRTKWHGVRVTNPTGLTTADQGAWWYRSDVGFYCYWDGSTVICWSGFGGKVSTGSVSAVIPIGGGCVGAAITVNTPEITNIINLVSLIVTDTDPDVCDVYTPIHISTVGNVVGITIGGVTGTTVTVRALATGYLF